MKEENKESLYRVTGYLYNSKKRFTINTSSLIVALSINLWRGNVWSVNEHGKKKLIKSVSN